MRCSVLLLASVLGPVAGIRQMLCWAMSHAWLTHIQCASHSLKLMS